MPSVKIKELVLAASLCLILSAQSAWAQLNIHVTSAAIEHLTNAIQVMPIDGAVAQQYGKIRAKLELAGKKIGNSDLWIAAQAKSEGWILITNNEREFKRVVGLKIEN